MKLSHSTEVRNEADELPGALHDIHEFLENTPGHKKTMFTSRSKINLDTKTTQSLCQNAGVLNEADELPGALPDVRAPLALQTPHSKDQTYTMKITPLKLK